MRDSTSDSFPFSLAISIASLIVSSLRALWYIILGGIERVSFRTNCINA